MMRNFKVIISYNGAAYHGFQRQSNGITVQEAIETAIKELIGETVTINGCSRTDAGVHAREYCFNFFTKSTIPCDGFVKGINAFLPTDIAVHSCAEVDDNFHARFDTKSKEYIYRISTLPIRDVFSESLMLHHPYPLDAEKMDKTAQLFVGRHDFAAFCTAESKTHLKSTVREIYSARVSRFGDVVEFCVSGGGFLHNMVRILAGTLVYHSDGKLSDDDIISAFSHGDRTKTGKTLPPQGLYLNKVNY